MCFDKDYNHKTAHQDLKRQMINLESNHKNLMIVLDSLNGNDKKAINYEGLLKFPLFEWVKINNRLFMKRRNNLFGDHLNFNTKILKGGHFGKHFHEDVIESAEVLEGMIKDEVDDTIYNRGDVMDYQKNQHHMPVALEDSILRVIFKR